MSGLSMRLFGIMKYSLYGKCILHFQVVLIVTYLWKVGIKQRKAKQHFGATYYIINHKLYFALENFLSKSLIFDFHHLIW
jgi:hypothetical protein